MRGTSALFCVLAGACLVTDQVQLDPENTTPPIVLAADIPIGAIIRFNTSVGNGELRIPLRIRDEDTAEPLIPRWRIKSGTKLVSASECPDKSMPEKSLITGTGELVRDDYEIVIERMQLERGACNQVEFVVSSAFLPPCERPEFFDAATKGEDDLGRAQFWVLEVSGDPLMTQAQTSTCAALDRTPQTTMESK
jgi:hypothetical protein